MSELTTATGTRQISEETPGLHAKREAFSSIPVIDFNDAYSSDLDTRKAVAEKIRKASIGVGFFYIKNHNIPQDLIEQVFTATNRFFTMPIDEKMELHVSRHEQHAGYIAVGGEKLHDQDEQSSADRKESLEISIGLSHDDAIPTGSDVYLRDTRWLARYPEIRNTMHTYYTQMWELAHLLNRISALALSLPEDFFEELFCRPITNIRCLSYPPLDVDTVQNDKTRACGEHSDYLCYTLLVQDDIGGLEVLNNAGEWVQAPPIPGTFVVNTGDLISHWTNDLFASTIHRVTYNQTEHYRHAIAFFTGPNIDAHIECLPSCKDVDNAPRYSPITTGDYLFQRLSSTVQYT